MRFPRRRSSGDSSSAYAPFWDWWVSEGRALAERSSDGPLDAAFREAMTAHVQAQGGLTWELADGEDAERVLVIRTGGDASLRPLARRVVLAAPEADHGWTYTDFRPPSPGLESAVLGTAEVSGIELSRVQVSARMNSGRFDVQVHHPAFGELSVEDRRLVTFLALEAALGEVDAELWLGEVQPVEFPPLDGFGLAALRSVVQDLKRQRLDADGQPRWVMLRGETPEGSLVAMVRSPLHPVTAPQLDTYVAVTVPYRDREGSGLPGEISLETLRGIEHRFGARLGNDGQVVAHLSIDGVRTFHLYVDSTTGALATVKEVAGAWDEGTTSVHDMHDPGWQAVAHLRQ